MAEWPLMRAAILLMATLLTRGDGLRLLPSPETVNPALFVVLPGHAESDHAIEIVFPEHVTVRKHGAAAAEHLYLSAGALHLASWLRKDNAIEYATQLPGSIEMRAIATLQDDGVLFRYEFTNASDVAYDMLTAITDPRMKSIFHDEQLERTYVHRKTGFELLAENRPVRLPSRYLAAFTWPVPRQLVETRDGLPYYNASRAVDAPFIATASTDRKWVVASFTRTTGNVWSNPELTCQHVDPEVALPGHGHATIEVKLLVMRGSIEDAYRKMMVERAAMQ